MLRWVALPFVLAACASPRSVVRDADYCAPPAMNAPMLAHDTAPPGAPRVEHLAALLGVAEGRPPVEEATVRVERARVGLAATIAELECEALRAEQSATVLAQREASATKRLTVASILVAAATGVASTFLSVHAASAGAQEGVAIGGAGAGAGFGLGALIVHPRLDFDHRRNALAELWAAPPRPSTFTPLPWAYLTRPVFSNRGDRAIRDNIIARWRRLGLLDDAQEVRLLLGTGGSYDADQLRARAAMLDDVRDEVALMNQDLYALLTSLGADVPPAR